MDSTNSLDLFAWNPSYRRVPGSGERYPHPLASHRGVDTSIAATERVAKADLRWRKEITEALMKHGALTAWEVEEKTGIDFDNCQPCISRMKREGLIVPGEEKRPNPKGAIVKTWRLR